MMGVMKENQQETTILPILPSMKVNDPKSKVEMELPMEQVVVVHTSPDGAVVDIQSPFHGEVVRRNSFATFWEEDCIQNEILEASIIQVLDQVIACKVTTKQKRTEFIVTTIYGSDDRTIRRTLWRDLKDQSRLGPSVLPWILIRDFNDIRKPEEKIGSHHMDWAAIEDFNNYIREVGLEELITRGFYFTWNDKREDGQHIMSKIDRMLINEKWLQSFIETDGWYLAPGLSNHSPRVCTIADEGRRQRKPFQFFNVWMKHKEFAPLVTDSWRKPIAVGSMLKSV
ncbi:hypothetical protein F0562_027470 [Nyssa sinensis]|uniref:Endonuclease/exonuclease/phosphatase domain-containing protein n=1 Tax=Nyssa sinensis TaxID=561372 RepID=A0A5J5B5R6_9ASTE|nr:hypothetical protein F0562_027470 [Nyssa sinensis]